MRGQRGVIKLRQFLVPDRGIDDLQVPMREQESHRHARLDVIGLGGLDVDGDSICRFGRSAESMRAGCDLFVEVGPTLQGTDRRAVVGDLNLGCATQKTAGPEEIHQAFPFCRGGHGLALVALQAGATGHHQCRQAKQAVATRTAQFLLDFVISCSPDGVVEDRGALICSKLRCSSCWPTLIDALGSSRFNQGVTGFAQMNGVTLLFGPCATKP